MTLWLLLLLLVVVLLVVLNHTFPSESLGQILIKEERSRDRLELVKRLVLWNDTRKISIPGAATGVPEEFRKTYGTKRCTIGHTEASIAPRMDEELRDGSEGGGAHEERFSTRAHRGERACRLVSPHPGSPPPGSRKHPPGSSRGLQRGVGTGTRTCFAGSDAARTPRCRDLSHSTAGLARSSPRERPGALMVDTAAAGGRRRQELWRFRYPSGAERGGRAAAQAPDSGL
ncbi:uncharacterized protein [Alexandromys fortis]|uniref:uncharacterized protein n=1 Tax=Alexandromys fortis TaxID=100897 RepID=UPI002153921C|nr:uncharacterized protein LOC126488462 [Microtus fortis]